MTYFIFSSPKAIYTTIIMYIVLAIVWCALYMTIRNDSHYRDKNMNFWTWWLGKDNPSSLSRFCNWVVFLIFILNIVRLALTLFFGFSGG